MAEPRRASARPYTPPPKQERGLFDKPPTNAEILKMPDVAEWVEERAAIMEFDGKQDAVDAMFNARALAIKRYNQGCFLT